MTELFGNGATDGLMAAQQQSVVKFALRASERSPLELRTTETNKRLMGFPSSRSSRGGLVTLHNGCGRSSSWLLRALR